MSSCYRRNHRGFWLAFYKSSFADFCCCDVMWCLHAQMSFCYRRNHRRCWLAFYKKIVLQIFCCCDVMWCVVKLLMWWCLIVVSCCRCCKRFVGFWPPCPPRGGSLLWAQDSTGEGGGDRAGRWFIYQTRLKMLSPGSSLRPLRGYWMGATLVCFGTHWTSAGNKMIILIFKVT